jgi:hypothetical protein
MLTGMGRSALRPYNRRDHEVTLAILPNTVPLSATQAGRRGLFRNAHLSILATQLRIVMTGEMFKLVFVVALAVSLMAIGLTCLKRKVLAVGFGGRATARPLFTLTLKQIGASIFGLASIIRKRDDFGLRDYCHLFH